MGKDSSTESWIAIKEEYVGLRPYKEIKQRVGSRPELNIFRQTRAHLNKRLRSALKAAAEPYIYSADGRYMNKKYGLEVDRRAIRIEHSERQP